MKKMFTTLALATMAAACSQQTTEPTSNVLDTESESSSLMTILSMNIEKDYFGRDGNVCYNDDRVVAKASIAELQGPFGGLSMYSRLGETGFEVTYLDSIDYYRAVEVIDDELDLNFDQYFPRDYARHNIGRNHKIFPCKNSYLASKAMDLKEAVGWETTFMSEGDYSWQPVFADTYVGEDMTWQDIKRAIGTTQHVHVYNEDDSGEFLEYLLEDDEFSANYSDLYEAVYDSGRQFRFVLVGESDSGALDLYLLLRTPRGQLIGLRTIDVQT